MVTISTDLILNSRRCIYRSPVKRDEDWILDALRNPSFPRQLPLGQLQSRGQVASWIQNCQRRWREGVSYTWTIERSVDRQPLGQVTLGQADSPNRWALAFWIEPGSWGNGYATEAANHFVRFAFEQMGVEKIWAGVALWNEGSRRVLEKIGMAYVRNNPVGYQINGEPVETMEYEINRQMWLAED